MEAGARRVASAVGFHPIERSLLKPYGLCAVETDHATKDRMDESERLQLRSTLKVAISAAKAASNITLVATKAASKATRKAALDASNRAANACLAALAANKDANAALDAANKRSEEAV